MGPYKRPAFVRMVMLRVFIVAYVSVLLSGCGFHSLIRCRNDISGLVSWDPFAEPGYAQLIVAKVMPAVMDARVRPTATVLGKRTVTIEECRAISLKNNLQIQVARLDEMTKDAIKCSTRRRMLPTINYSNELSDRDNQRWSYGDTFGPKEGQAPDRSSTSGLLGSFSNSHERNTWRQTLELRWSPTDAALAFYLARNATNDLVKSNHKRVRVAQEIVGTVDAAFYRLLSCQEAYPLARQLVNLRKGVERNMRNLNTSQLKDMADYHRVREKAIKADQDILSMEAELQKQRNLLASALAVSPDDSRDGGIQAVGTLTKPTFSASIPDLEVAAVKARPEAYQAGLDHINSVNDLKRTIAKYFPKITGFWRKSRDKDKYSWEKDWTEVGVTVYFDLVEWLANRDDHRTAAVSTIRTERELAIVALGITSQVRGAAQKYFEALGRLKNSESFLDNSTRLLETAEIRARGDRLDEQAVQEIRGDVLSERIRVITALGEANAALAELFAAMGTNYREPVPAPH